jgi:hypothetical protein
MLEVDSVIFASAPENIERSPPIEFRTLEMLHQTLQEILLNSK